MEAEEGRVIASPDSEAEEAVLFSAQVVEGMEAPSMLAAQIHFHFRAEFQEVIRLEEAGQMVLRVQAVQAG
jgi:hypothetical protein